MVQILVPRLRPQASDLVHENHSLIAARCNASKVCSRLPAPLLFHSHVAVLTSLHLAAISCFYLFSVSMRQHVWPFSSSSKYCFLHITCLATKARPVRPYLMQGEGGPEGLASPGKTGHSSEAERHWSRTSGRFGPGMGSSCQSAAGGRVSFGSDFAWPFITASDSEESLKFPGG